MKYHLRILFIALLGIVGSAQSFADNVGLTEQSIKAFYQNMIDARIAGGTYLISFHKKHYHDDLSLIISLERTVGGNSMPKTFMDHDKVTFMKAVEKNDKVINQESGTSKIIKFSIDEGGHSAVVDSELSSVFFVQVDKLASPKQGREVMKCQDKIVLSDAQIIQILSSQCNTHVYLD